ncbi:MAG: zinc-dependent peptidase [Planctomycetes bacterium]|nr:zinc-dependent peptidase [Planctomycetota bacterium]
MNKCGFYITVLVAPFFVSAISLHAQAKSEPNSYNHLFEVRNICGWTVYINKQDLLDHPDQMNAALEYLHAQFYQVTLNVPRAAVTQTQQRGPIWFEYDTLSSIAYHGRGWLIANKYRPPDVKTVIGLTSAKTFMQKSYHQPWVVFHELTHCYDHRFLRSDKSYDKYKLDEVYDNAMEKGIYDAVLCRYSLSTKHYGANNRGEYFAESSEAYFGANDFYPFVRAELKEYDPDMYYLLQNLWGVDVADQQKRTKDLANFLDSDKKDTTCNQSFIPTEKYYKTDIKGWTVYVSPLLRRLRAYSQKILDLLEYKLYLIDLYMPVSSLEKLKTTPVWLELENNAVPYIAYHHCENTLKAKGLNPDKLNAIEIGSSGNFARWQEFQKFILLRYLAYACYDKYLPDQQKQIDSAYANTLKSGKYTSVLRFDGRKVRHPALNSAREYFATMTESYYGLSGHYPFIQFELRQYDPNTCDLMSKLWGSKAK